MDQFSKFLIIDGNSICFRAVSAKPAFQDELVNSAGKETGGILRFINILNKTLELVRPTHVIVGFDTSGKTFRHDIDPEYKANRENKDKDRIYSQFNDIKRVLEALGIKHDNILGYEGDDLVGTYAELSYANRNYILSGDKDIFQLINDNTSVIYPLKGVSEVKVYDKQAFADRFGISVEQFIDYKTLLGDAGDNVKGLDGCGEKTTAVLLQKYGTIENIFNNLDTENKDIRGWKSLSKKIASWDYTKPRKLVTIKKDVDVKYTYDDCEFKINWQNAIPLFEEFEFTQLISRVKGGKMYK